MRNAEFYCNHPLFSGSKDVLRRYVADNAKRGTDSVEIERRVNALYDFLLDHTDTKSFDESAALIADGETLSYWQYAEKKYTPEGTEQQKMNLVFTLIPRKLYADLELLGSEERADRLFSDSFMLKERWTADDTCDGHFYCWYKTGDFSRNYCFFAKSYLKCFDYVMICAYSEI